MLYRFNFATVVLVSLLIIGAAKAHALVQMKIDQEELYQSIQEAYNNYQDKKVVKLTGEFIDRFPTSPNKIKAYELRAYSQYNLGFSRDARESIIEILRIDINFATGENVKPENAKFVKRVIDEVTAELTIQTELSNLNMTVNGGLKMKIPCTLKLLEGEYNIKVDSPSDSLQDWMRTIAVKGGEPLELKVIFESKGLSKIPPEKKEPGSGDKNKKSWHKKPLVWVAGGVVVGGIIYFLWPSHYDGPSKLPMHPARPNN